jgi:rsbT co-antagonist protein RsbR
MGIDITEQKRAEQALLESEARFRNIIESVPMGMHMYHLESDGRLIFTGANPAADQILGVDNSLFVDKPIEEAFPALAETEAPDRYRAAAAEGQAWRNEQISYDQGQIQGAFEVYAFQTSPSNMVAAFLDVTERKRAEMEREQLQKEVIEAQQRAIKELSTPVIPLMKTSQGGILVMPLVGSIDSMRAKDLMRTLLAGISQHRAKVVILDVTGVPIVDSGVANHLNKTIMAARLKGARTIVTGITDAVAETIVDLGIDWTGIETLSDLQTGLIAALGSLDIRLSQSP